MEGRSYPYDETAVGGTADFSGERANQQFLELLSVMATRFGIKLYTYLCSRSLLKRLETSQYRPISK
ncbi:MAG TPA: hypothetical protein VF020_01960 [Chthoniobacterales bacterium]